MTKIPNKRELEQIVLNHTSDIEFKDFMKRELKKQAKIFKGKYQWLNKVHRFDKEKVEIINKKPTLKKYNR